MGNSEVEVHFVPWPYDAVARGVVLLDEKVPGWRERIDLSTLDLGDPLLCVAGQVDVWGKVWGDVHHGFDVPDPTFDYAVLQGAWLEAIAGGSK